MPHPNFISSCDFSEFKGHGLLQKANLAVRAPRRPHSVAFLTLLPATRGVLCLQHLDSISPSPLISCVSGFPEAHPLLLALCTHAPRAILSLPPCLLQPGGPDPDPKGTRLCACAGLGAEHGAWLATGRAAGALGDPCPSSMPRSLWVFHPLLSLLRGWGFLLHPEPLCFVWSITLQVFPGGWWASFLALCSRTRKAAWPWLLPLGALEEEGSSTSAVVLPWGAQALPLRGAGKLKLELV